MFFLSLSLVCSVQQQSMVPTDPTPPTSPVLSRKLGREGNVFSRLTSGATSGENSRPNSGVVRPYDVVAAASAKPIPKSSSSLLTCIHVAEGHSGSVLDVVATEELMFSASTDRTVKVWDLRRGHETASLGEHANGVVVVRYCPRTRQVFSASSAYVNVWDLRESNTRCIKTLHSSGLSTDGSVSVSTPSRPLRMPPGENQINDVRTPDGTTLFTAAGSLVRMWDLRNYCSIGKLSGSHQAAVTCLAVEDVDRRGRSTCVVTGSKDHYVKLFEIAALSSGVHQAKVDLEPPHYDGIQALALRGNVLFSGSRDMCIKKWDLKKFKLKQSLNQAHKDWVCGLCFASDRHHLLSCCRSGHVRQWSVDTCRLIGEVKAHGSSVNAIVANGSRVFTASNDTTIRIWRPRDVDDIPADDAEHV